MSDLLYKGCMIPSRLPFIEAAAKYIIDRLDLDITDTGEHVCCIEPVGLRAMDHDVWLNVTSYISGLSAGGRVVTLCDGCNLSLSESVKERGSEQEIVSLLEVIHDNLDSLRSKVIVKQDLALAIFPGCHAESTMACRGKDACSVMSDIVSAIGCRPLIPAKDLCCGGGLMSVNDDLSRRILSESVESFRSTGADAVVTACPFCFIQFDTVARYRTYSIFELVARSLGWNLDTERYHRGKK